MTRLRAFLVGGALLIAASVVAVGLAVESFFERHVLDEEAEHSIEVVRNQAVQHLPADAFSPTPASAAMFQTFFEGLPRVFRVKAFAPDGRIVWSNEPRLIGQRFTDNRNLARALAGQSTTVLEQPKQSEHVFEQTHGYVAEAYVPIAFPPSGRVVGVVETYKDMTAVVAGIAAVKRHTWVTAGATGLLLYLALALVAWRASASEYRARRTLERQNAELVALQRFSQGLLGPLNLAELAQQVVVSTAEGLALAHAALYRADGASLAPLATWPAHGESSTAALAVEALAAGERLQRGSAVALVLTPTKGPAHVFVADFGAHPPPPDSAELRGLEIMLAQAATALANVASVMEIEEARERIAAILSGITDEIVILDRDMRVVWMNASAAAAGGAAVGEYCYDKLGGDPEGCRECPGGRALVSGAVERGVRAHSTRAGVTRYLDLVAAPLRDAGGEVSRVLEVARDVTELVEMDTRLKETNRALVEAQTQLVEKERLAAVGEMVVGLHHAILNPLTGVLGALQVLRGQPLDAGERARVLAEAQAEIVKVSRLIQNLAALRRADGTPYVRETRMLDLADSAPSDVDSN
jgi:PAS domain-containing protein